MTAPRPRRPKVLLRSRCRECARTIVLYVGRATWEHLDNRSVGPTHDPEPTNLRGVGTLRPDPGPPPF